MRVFCWLPVFLLVTLNSLAQTYTEVNQMQLQFPNAVCEQLQLGTQPTDVVIRSTSSPSRPWVEFYPPHLVKAGN